MTRPVRPRESESGVRVLGPRVGNCPEPVGHPGSRSQAGRGRGGNWAARTGRTGVSALPPPDMAVTFRGRPGSAADRFRGAGAPGPGPIAVPPSPDTGIPIPTPVAAVPDAASPEVPAWTVM